MNRLLQPARTSNRVPNADAEIMADRAAEVLRCVEPAAIGDEDSLGTLGDYRLLRLIGAGGTGVVFQAKDVSLDRVVALKVLRPSLGDIARDRFIAEARLAASIEHDNVVTIYQIGTEGRLAFIAMQWLPGETLEARLNREPVTLEEATIREFVTQIASGLAAAHKRQLIHRDIKPANIWICDDTGRIKILDFGLARVADEESSLTQTGMLAGTPSFMSPEQSKGMELDPRSDLFSLGCVMYKLLTGKLPFSATTVLGTLQTIQSDSPQPPITINPNCNADLSDLTMSLLEKLPGNRMASAENLIRCLTSNRSNWPHIVPAVANTGATPPSASAATPKGNINKTVFRRWTTAAILLGLLAIPAWLFSPQIYRIATNQGELVIETSDENIKVQVLKNGEEVNVIDSSTGNSIEITAGKYTFSATSNDKFSEFKISPESVVLNRGGKEIISVSLSPKTAAPLNEPKAPLRNLITNDLSDPAASLRQLLRQNRWVIDRDPGKAQLSKKRTAQLQAAIKVMQGQRGGYEQRLGADHPHLKTFDQQLLAMNSMLEDAQSTTELSAPIYGGRNFDQWLHIVMNDREPKTVAEAIGACATLATENQKPTVLDMVRKLMRQHGELGSNPNPSHNGIWSDEAAYFSGFVKALSQLEPEEVVAFIQTEIETGNNRSLGCCSDLLIHCFNNGDKLGEKALEFHRIRSFDLNPLLNRILKGELELASGARYFLDGVITNSKSTVDLELAKELLREITIEERDWLYRTFTIHFWKSELNDDIVQDFLSDKTPGKIREQYLQTLVPTDRPPNYIHAGGRLIPTTSHKSLASRLIIKSIEKVAADEPIDFDSYNEIWFNDEGEVKTTFNNDERVWAGNQGAVTRIMPEGTRHIKGKAAIIRHLLTKLCLTINYASQSETERNAVIDEVKTFVSSIKSKESDWKQLMKSDEFQSLKIGSDLNDVGRFSIGEDFDFSPFVTNQKSINGPFGGGGGFGGGIF